MFTSTVGMALGHCPQAHQEWCVENVGQATNMERTNSSVDPSESAWSLPSTVENLSSPNFMF